MVSRTPATLKIHEDSHLIYKSSSSAASSNSQQHRRRQPVIIYTMPPKVIYSNARDFKALVQRLTGLPNPPAKECSSSSSSAPHPTSPPTLPEIAAYGGSLPSSSSSSDNCIGGGDHGVTACLPASSPDISFEAVPPPADLFVSDGKDIFDLLTSSDFFCPQETPEPLYEPSNPSVAGLIERSGDAFFLGI